VVVCVLGFVFVLVVVLGFFWGWGLGVLLTFYRWFVVYFLFVWRFSCVWMMLVKAKLLRLVRLRV